VHGLECGEVLELLNCQDAEIVVKFGGICLYK
jgi:hypothetical protein